MFKIAIVGRTNVGKSTLFNKLTGRRTAIVHNEKGVTRDRKEAKADFFGIPAVFIDTGGFETFTEDDELHNKIIQQSLKSAEDADVILFMCDLKEGLTALDKEYSGRFRKFKDKIVLVLNKADIKNSEDNLYDFYSLGFSEPVLISSEHNIGFNDIYDRVSVLYESFKKENYTDTVEEEKDENAAEDNNKIKLAIVGRPNAGKSTLLNAMFGEERMITGDMPGLTRDSVSSELKYKGRDFEIIDTPGLRKKAKVYQILEKMSVSSAIETVKKANIVLIVTDINSPLDKQDLQIARFAYEEGKVCVFVFNKCDLVDLDPGLTDDIKRKLKNSFAQIKDPKTVYISALRSKGIDKILNSVLDVFKSWNKKISTAKLNLILKKLVGSNPPPLSRLKRPINIKYLTQKSTRPPTFLLFTSTASKLPDSYKKYLINGISDAFDLESVPVRLILAKSKNPYAKTGSKK